MFKRAIQLLMVLVAAWLTAIPALLARSLRGYTVEGSWLRLRDGRWVPIPAGGAAKMESIEQTTSGTWAASSTVTILLDRIGLVTRYETVFELTPSATMLAANQPDGLFRAFRNVQFVAGGQTYFALPDEAAGHGSTLLHYLNVLDGFGRGFVHQLIAAPSQTFYVPRLTFHAGVRPKRRDGVDNPFDLTAFLPAGIESSPQITWLTTAAAVVDDTVTLSSGTLYVKAHRVLGTTQDIMEEMAAQGVLDLVKMVQSGAEGIFPQEGATGFVPGWYGQVEAPTATAANYGSELDAQLGGFLKRVTILTQDATATRPGRADDEVTAIKFFVPEKSLTVMQSRSEFLAGALPDGDFLVADDAAGLGGVGVAPGGIYPIDLRPYGQTTIEKVMGYDTRGRQSGYAKWGRTINTNTSGDDIFTLSERILVYAGRLSNS